ncbi:MAG TPA: hypothetical protein VJV78_24100 [Polyangiales bacterium]|nr:hypothetical protein [Polyangiales bacterium]
METKHAKRSRRRLLVLACVGAALITGSVGSAFAVGVQDECSVTNGYLTFLDFGPNGGPGRCGHLFDWNDNWNDFGWGNRADDFRNDGRTHNACIYPSVNYQGVPRHLIRGQVTRWYDTVDSNAWTTSPTCPRPPAD